ncbi:MAG: hypothetical protein LBQ62_04185, partial [Candidatus Accumulibacter sp.]|nr:hypothetical protein [Accumulibacter sp.]
MILAPSFPPKAGKRRGISLAGLALCCFLRVLAPGPALAGEAAPAARDEALEKRFDAIVAE